MTLESSEGLRKIAFLGNEVVLRAPASLSFDLQGVAVGAEQILTWDPVDKQAMTLEVRARILGTNVGNALIPIVRWWSEVSHGEKVWREPPPFAQAAGVEFQDFGLPGRGMTFRVNSRRFRIGFRNDGARNDVGIIVPPDPIKNTLAVSVLPVCTPGDAYPPSTYQTLDAIGSFPMTAREWRVMGLDGLQQGGTGPDALFWAVSGYQFDDANQTLYDEWMPIPHDAAGFSFNAGAPPPPGNYAAFR